MTQAGGGQRFNECGNLQVRADITHDAVDLVFGVLLGGVEVMERRRIPGADHSTELAELQDSHAWLLDQVTMRGPALRPAYERQLTKVTSRIEHLAAQPILPPRTELVSTGKTYGEVWAESSDPERRDLLKRGGFRVVAAQRSGPLDGDEMLGLLGKIAPVPGGRLPAEIAERLRA